MHAGIGGNTHLSLRPRKMEMESSTDGASTMTCAHKNKPHHIAMTETFLHGLHGKYAPQDPSEKYEFKYYALTGWKRLSRAGSFSMYFLCSSSVVAPMQRNCPLASNGFSKLPATHVHTYQHKRPINALTLCMCCHENTRACAATHHACMCCQEYE
jgi:hypothetical protein